MYNLLVAGDESAFETDVFTLPKSRCVSEYTDEHIIQNYGSLDPVAFSRIRRFPCLFCYEIPTEKEAKFGYFNSVHQFGSNIELTYRIEPTENFFSMDRLVALSARLAIRGWELNRTHWAIKDVNLFNILANENIHLTNSGILAGPSIDIESHRFRVALSFPGTARNIVAPIASELDHLLGENKCFYDENYSTQLARPQLDILLQNIYRDRADLIVVFIGANYQSREWCGIEWRAVREIIHQREDSRIMFIKLDDGIVEGVSPFDGYIDVNRFTSRQLAEKIFERVNSSSSFF